MSNEFNEISKRIREIDVTRCTINIQNAFKELADIFEEVGGKKIGAIPRKDSSQCRNCDYYDPKKAAKAVVDDLQLVSCSRGGSHPDEYYEIDRELIDTLKSKLED